MLKMEEIVREPIGNLESFISEWCWGACII